MKKFVYLDVGETLLHLVKHPYEIYGSVLQRHGLLQEIVGDKKFFIEQFHIAMKEMSSKPNPELKDRYTIHPGGQDGWWTELIDLFLQKIHSPFIKPSLEVYQEIFAIFENPNLWKVNSGFEDLLSFAKENQIGLGIISNWDLRLRNLLERKNLISYFNPVLISAEFGYEKPSLKIFLHAQELVGLESSQLFYVGDKPELDYYPPKKLGWNAFLIHHSTSGDIPTIQDLSELISYLKG
ncbi:MAG: HAD-IA family hydrolase [Candidatus Pacearchaeota archaeon]